MLNTHKIEEIEELAMNALPAIQTMFYKGWIIRMANGYTKRANSINPLYHHSFTNDEKNTVNKINEVERILHTKNIKPVYKINSDAQMQKLDMALQDKGYHYSDLTSVKVADLTNLSFPENSSNSLIISERLTDDWLQNVCMLNNINLENRKTLQHMLQLIIPEVRYFTLKNNENNEVVACGMSVLQREYLGLFDIVTNRNYRNKGHGLDLVSRILKWGLENGAEKAYLQVMTNNYPALKLYEKLGFQEKYTYWYRSK